MGPWATPPPRHWGARLEPWRARPVPFWRHGLAPPPDTSARPLVEWVPERAAASWAVTTWCMTGTLGWIPKMAAGSSGCSTTTGAIRHHPSRRCGRRRARRRGRERHPAPGAGADRPGGAVLLVGAVGGALALEVVALDVAGEPFALGDAGHVDLLAGGEDIGRDDLAHGEGTGIVDPQLGQVAGGDGVVPLEVARLRLVHPLWLYLADGELHGRVAVALGGLHRDDAARPGP